MGCFSFLVCALVILLFVIRTDWKNKLSPEAELAQVLFAKAEKDKEIEGIKVSHTNELRLIDGRRVIARKDQLEAEQKLYRFVLDLAVNIEEDALAIRPLLAAEETIYAAIRDSKLVQYDGKDKLARRVYLKLPYYESLKDRIDMSAMPKLPTGLDLDARLREERQYLSRKISDLAAAEPS